jgi:hypothetical protein
MKHNKKTKSQRKAKEGHIEEGKNVKPTNGTKSGKPRQKGKEELRKGQNQTPLNRTLPNTLNASSPP